MIQLLTPKSEYTIDYQKAIDYATTQSHIFWTPDEIEVEKDLHDIRTNFTEAEYHGIISTLKLFTLYELKVGNEYWGNYISKIFPRPDIQRMANCFSYFELNVHAVFYNKINEVLGLDTDDFYNSYLDDPILKNRMQWIEKRVSKSDTDYDRLKSLAAFSMIEGAILYSSFAFLKHFQSEGKNKLVNVTAGINFSVKDESVTPDTEVLTTTGWKRIDSIDATTKIAQFNPKNKEISFVIPERIVSHVEEKLYHFKSTKGGISQKVTPNHRMPVRDDWKEDIYFKSAKDIKYHTKNLIPVSGNLVGNEDLTVIERFFIAIQADGHISSRYTGERVGTVPISFSLSKDRKINRLRSLLVELGFKYKESYRDGIGNKKNQIVFKVDFPVDLIDISLLKTFGWINLNNKSSKWCNDFILEISEWDGSKLSESSIYYSSKLEGNVDIVQAISHLCGYSASKHIQIDNRSDKFSDIYRLNIFKKDEKRGGGINKEEIDYNNVVYCVTVPTGAFLIRHDNKVSVTGNCLHSEAGAWLFKTYLDELDPNNDFRLELFSEITETAQIIYEHECVIIDKIFERGEIKGITSSQLKAFVQHRVDLCLNQLGLKSIFNPTDTTVESWFYKNINSSKLVDFFVKQSNEYNRNWNENKFTWNTK